MPRPSSEVQKLFVMYSANAPRDAPQLFERYFTEGDYARTESLSRPADVPRRFRYALPTTLRVQWNGEPGVRAWTRRGCGPDTPGTIVYDPEIRPDWTPPAEVERLAESIREAARLVRSTRCHLFGIAPGSLPFFGLDPHACEVDLDEGVYDDDLPWHTIDLVDVQVQRLIGEHCLQRDGLARYAETVTQLAAFLRRENPDIQVVAQVSFRDSDAFTMAQAIERVAEDVDGIFFSYPTTNADIPCLYCSPSELEALLRYLEDA